MLRVDTSLCHEMIIKKHSLKYQFPKCVLLVVATIFSQDFIPLLRVDWLMERHLAPEGTPSIFLWDSLSIITRQEWSALFAAMEDTLAGRSPGRESVSGRRMKLVIRKKYRLEVV